MILIGETQIRVRYADTDQMGYVYYGTYAAYYEIARVETLRQMGLSYKMMEEEMGVMLPVLENHSRYLMPARFDDLLTVKVYVDQMPSVKINYRYEFFNQDGALIHTGHTMLVFMNSNTRRACRIPASIAERFRPYFQ
jgi:acyl-CoA thioester hydrolase